MNRIYQGKVTDVEIHVPANKEKPSQPFDPDPKQAKAKWQSAILSASNDAPRSRERERVVADRVRVVGEKRSIAERNEVRCRNPFNQLSTLNHQLSALGYRSSVIGDSPKAHAHQPFQDAVN